MIQLCTMQQAQYCPAAGGEAHIARVHAWALSSHLHDLITQKVVTQQNAPQLLRNHLRRLASQRVFAAQKSLLDLPGTQFDFPALTIKVDDLITRKT